MNPQQHIQHFLNNVLGFQSSPYHHDECKMKVGGFLEYTRTCNFMTFELVNIAIYSFVACHLLERIARFASFYLSETYRNFKTEVDRFDWSNRVVAFVHAVVSATLALYGLMTEPQTWSDSGSGYAESYVSIVMISIGYFLYDIVVLVRYYAMTKTIDIPIVVHHLICMGGILHCVNYRVGILPCVELLFTEATTPFLHIRWYLMKMNMKESPIFNINNLVFYFAFFICRVLWCIVVNIHLYMTSDSFSHFPIFALTPIFIPAALGILNIYWFSMMTANLLRRRKKASTEETMKKAS